MPVWAAFGDAKLAFALVNPAAPLGEDVAPAILLLGFLEGGILYQVLLGVGWVNWDQDNEYET